MTLLPDNTESHPLVLRPTPKGIGVFASTPVDKDMPVIRFNGPVVSKSQYMADADYRNNHFLQVGSNHFMGPSGGLDDLINHSCDPNTGLLFSETGIWLHAIRKIDADEEICFDYSTTMDEDYWEMPCICGSPNCRKYVKDFKHLPPDTQQKYIAMGIVPDFIASGIFKKR